MIQIPVVIVDDGEADRYLVKRRLSRSSEFCELMEMPSGDRFLDEFFSDKPMVYSEQLPLLVLMDINMPGRDGFQTVEEVSLRMANGRGPGSVVVLMYTSSLNVRDQERASEYNIVKGYLPKPMRNESIDFIQRTYRLHCAA